jgi:hypothetical protein
VSPRTWRQCGRVIFIAVGTCSLTSSARPRQACHSGMSRPGFDGDGPRETRGGSAPGRLRARVSSYSTLTIHHGTSDSGRVRSGTLGLVAAGILWAFSAPAVAASGPYQIGNTWSCLVGYGLPVIREGPKTLIWTVVPGSERIYIDFMPLQPVSGAHANARIAGSGAPGHGRGGQRCLVHKRWADADPASAIDCRKLSPLSSNNPLGGGAYG